MNRTRGRAEPQSETVPRTRGDEPKLWREVTFGVTRSPHTRG